MEYFAAEKVLRHTGEKVEGIPDIVSIITARGGSKGVHGKNIRSLAGKPLIAYSIDAALQCPYITRCIVSTDDKEIKQVSLCCGAEVQDRPSELAGDHTLSRDVIRYVLETMLNANELPEYFVLLQPTSPLRNATHLSQCVQEFFLAGANSAVSITEAEHHPFKSIIRTSDDVFKPIDGYECLDAVRQTLPKAYRTNGAIYLGKSELFLEHSSFFVQPIYYYPMEKQNSVDVDNEIDFLIAEKVMRELT